MHSTVFGFTRPRAWTTSQTTKERTQSRSSRKRCENGNQRQMFAASRRYFHSDRSTSSTEGLEQSFNSLNTKGWDSVAVRHSFVHPLGYEIIRSVKQNRNEHHTHGHPYHHHTDTKQQQQQPKQPPPRTTTDESRRATFSSALQGTVTSASMTSFEEPSSGTAGR